MSEPQMLIPLPAERRPTLLVVGVTPTGRLYRCLRCGRECWGAAGSARRHRRYCRRRDWPEGRPSWYRSTG